MTLTAPRVSTVFNDLQRILFLRMRFAVIVSEAVKAIGRPSGINAIATETQSTIRVGTLIQSGYDFLKYAALHINQYLESASTKNYVIDVPYNDYKSNHGYHESNNHKNKVENLSLKSSHTSFWGVGKLSNPSKDSCISSSNDDTDTTSGNTMSSLKSDTSCLQVIFVCIVNHSRKWKRFA